MLGRPGRSRHVQWLVRAFHSRASSALSRYPATDWQQTVQCTTAFCVLEFLFLLYKLYLQNLQNLLLIIVNHNRKRACIWKDNSTRKTDVGRFTKMLLVWTYMSSDITSGSTVATGTVMSDRLQKMLWTASLLFYSYQYNDEDDDDGLYAQVQRQQLRRQRRISQRNLVHRWYVEVTLCHSTVPPVPPHQPAVLPLKLLMTSQSRGHTTDIPLTTIHHHHHHHHGWISDLSVVQMKVSISALRTTRWERLSVVQRHYT